MVYSQICRQGGKKEIEGWGMCTAAEVETSSECEKTAEKHKRSYASFPSLHIWINTNAKPRRKRVLFLALRSSFTTGKAALMFQIKLPSWHWNHRFHLFLHLALKFNMHSNTYGHTCVQIFLSAAYWFILATAQMFQRCVAAVDDSVCVCVCTCMHSTRRVHAYMHSCMYTSIDVCVCVCVLICVCNWGVGGLVVVLVGGVWSFFKHSCVVMVA